MAEDNGKKKKERRGRFIKSIDTVIIENRLRNTVPGEIVTYEELSTLLGRDYVEFCRSNGTTAQKSLMSEHSMFFDCVRGVGYRRLTDDETNGYMDHFRKSIKTTSRNGVRCSELVPYEKLSEPAKRKHDAVRSTLEVTSLFTADSALKKIEKAVENNSARLSNAETMRLFGVKPPKPEDPPAAVPVA